MSDKKKTRIRYVIEPTWDKVGYNVTTHVLLPVNTAEEALTMVMSMYKLEDPDDIDVGFEVKGVEAMDLLFNIEK